MSIRPAFRLHLGTARRLSLARGGHMSYPLPGETITRTMTGVEFGCAPPRDEPAPPEIATYFRALQEAFDDMGMLQQQWTLDRSKPAFAAYSLATGVYERIYNALLKKLRRHRDRCFTCDGHRFWLHVESHGC